MPDPCSAQATLILSGIFTLLGKLVWPVFLLLLFRRADIDAHVRAILKSIERISKLKAYGVEMTFVAPEKVQSVRGKEKERELVLESRPRGK